MILPKPIRKIIAIFRGGVSPVIIFLSILLGFWFGIIPGFYGLHVAIILLMLILNIHTGMFLLSLGLGKALCFAAAPVLFHIGTAVLNYVPGLVGILSAIPIIGITDFSRYAVIGGLVVGPIVGGIAGLLMASSVIRFRRMMLKLEEGSEKFRIWYSKGWVKLLDRILIGKRAKDAKAMFTAKAKIIRKAGVVLAVLVLGGAAAATILVKDNVARDYAATTMTNANGAEVNLKSLDLSVLSGAVGLTGLQVTDAKQPQNNQVTVDKISADASVYDLLLGKLVMENVEVSNVKFNQPRAEPGKVIETPAEEPETFDPCEYKVSATDIAKLETYFKDAKALKEKLQKARKWLPKSEGEEEQAAEAETQAEQAQPQKYLDYLLARASVPASPRMLAKRIALDKVDIPSKLFGVSNILLKNISDSASTAGLPVSIKMDSNDTDASINATFDYSSGAAAPKVTGAFDKFDLSKLQSSLSGDSGLMFEKGMASGKFDGEITDKLIDLTINLNISDLNAKAQGKGVLGMDAKTASEALAVLKNIDTTLRIVGPITEPRLVFDVKGLQDEFKKALINAGKEKLAGEVNKQIDEQVDKQLGDKAPTEIKDAIKKSTGLLDGLLKKDK